MTIHARTDPENDVAYAMYCLRSTVQTLSDMAEKPAHRALMAREADEIERLIAELRAIERKAGVSTLQAAE